MHIYIRFLFSIFSLLPIICHAQADTIYYDENGVRTDFDNADYYRVITLQEDNKYKVDEHSLNNKLKMTGHFLSLDTNHAYSAKSGLEVSDGPFIYYNKKGDKESEGSYDKNKRVGEWKHYYETPNVIWYISRYKDGKTDGELTSYYKDGKVKRREQHQLSDTAITGKCFDEQGNEIEFTRFETMPRAVFNIPNFLSENIIYPAQAKKKDIEGRVIIKFVVNEDGSISSVKAIKRIGGGCDEEAMRVVSAMPKWEAGIQDDKKVKVYFTLPIVFKLTD